MDTLHEYVATDVIGEGTFGTVYRALSRSSGLMVAIKKVRRFIEDEGVPHYVIREVAVLRELQHPNIVCLFDVVMVDSDLYLVFELLFMDLRKYILSVPSGQLLNMKLVQSYMYQLLQGILYCHQRGVFHRDLKPVNLLVNEWGLIKIADFGMARALGFSTKTYARDVTTLWYRAPEVLLGHVHYSCAVDMWSLGCIFAEMVTKQPLFIAYSEITQLFKIFSILTTPTEDTWPGVTKMPSYSSSFPKYTKYMLAYHVRLDILGMDLLANILSYDPCSRFSAKTALQHPYFSDVDKTSIPPRII